SIAESWRENADYTSVRVLARQKPIQEQQTIGDFEFVINDRATYRVLSDFNNDRARSIYSQAQGLRNQLSTLRETLSEQREQYGAGESGNSSLRGSILQLEQQEATLHEEIQRLEIQARNQEIRS